MIKQHAEERAMTEIPDYVYTTYIHATAEQVWHALTDAELTARFWGHAQVSNWRVGSRVEHVRSDGSGTVDVAGTVMAVDPPRRLVFGFGEPSDDPTAEESVVAFDIEPFHDIVKLTVTHTNLPSAADRESIGQGWPTVFANLKTLLETGDVLPTAPWEFYAAHSDAERANSR
jgi:uncharacterized protein YndB with AHSA1/START domain